MFRQYDKGYGKRACRFCGSETSGEGVTYKGKWFCTKSCLGSWAWRVRMKIRETVRNA